jgi:hypothetical protein
MQITFPTAQGYAGMFVVGQRERAGQVERTGTAVLKRAYRVDSVAGTLTPAAEPLAVFQQDQPYNLVLNGDFEAPQPADPATPPDLTTADGWTFAPTTFSRVPLVGVDFSAALGPSTAARLSGAGATLVQTIAFDQPLGGRSFTLSFYANTSPAAPIINVQARLEDPDGVAICAINATLTLALQRFSSQGTWPATVTAKEARIILEAPTDPARIVFYDRVQLEERTARTKWDPETELRYESDLAPVKPDADLIVLGYANISGASQVSVGSVTWLQRNVAAPAGELDKALFGWQSRVVDGPRKQAVGTIPLPPGTPAPPALLPNFQNAFYNGYRRDAAFPPPPPFPAFAVQDTAAEVLITRAAPPNYRFFLRGDTAGATLQFYPGTGPDDEAHWSQEPVSMMLDTIVVEPDADRCYLVWRGAWGFDDIPATAYRRLTVTASP